MPYHSSMKPQIVLDTNVFVLPCAHAKAQPSDSSRCSRQHTSRSTSLSHPCLNMRTSATSIDKHVDSRAAILPTFSTSCVVEQISTRYSFSDARPSTTTGSHSLQRTGCVAHEALYPRFVDTPIKLPYTRVQALSGLVILSVRRLP
jgi:hypothetical protein